MSSPPSWKDLHASIAADYQRIAARVLEDPGTAGDQVEETWAALLRQWLPATYPVVTKGRILNELGFTSPQVDILVLRPHYPLALRNQKLYFAAGVVAAFECKLTIRRPHIRRFFETAKLIKGLYEARSGSPYLELTRPIYYGLLAHSHAWKGSRSSADTRLWSAVEEYEQIAEHPADLPDALCVADVATFLCSRTLHISKRLDEDERKLFDGVDPRGGVATCFYHYADDSETERRRGEVIASLISNIIYRLAFEDESLQTFADYLLQIPIYVGSGRPFPWPRSVLSREVVRHIMREGYDYARWSHWSNAL